MGKLTIEGGQRLEGTITVSGAKNAALPIIAGAILLESRAEITNIPNVTDIVSMVRVLRALGIRAEYLADQQTLRTWGNAGVKCVAPYELVTRMRASFFVAGPVLAMTGLAKIPLPGGCSIGTRPVDLHLKGFRELGADIRIEHGIVCLHAKRGLTGAKIYLDFPSVGATENIMMAATRAKGVTTIANAAREPEIVDLAEFLNKAGARITGAGSEEIIVEGVNHLSGLNYRVMPDRIEAGTLLIAGAATHSTRFTIVNAVIAHIEPVIQKMQEMGVEFKFEENAITVKKANHLKAVDFETGPFPGFPTDMQAQMMALLIQAEGTSMVKETVFENRFQHAQEMNRMGAMIKVEQNTAIIQGGKPLQAAPVKISDLRAGAALLIAALTARGTSTIFGTHHIERGYDDLPGKLIKAGARIKIDTDQISYEKPQD